MRKVRVFNWKNVLLVWLLVWGMLFDRSVQLKQESLKKYERIPGEELRDEGKITKKKEERKASETEAKEALKLCERTQKEPVIRVLLMTTGYESYEHNEVSGWCGGQSFYYDVDSPELHGTKPIRLGKDGEITITSIQRQCGNPVYAGILEIRRHGEYLHVINELPLETYLKSVVPSEMPASYGKEALKAQAICARTYAWKHILGNGLKRYHADVDDSVNYQVYGNVESQASTDCAVEETKGEILCQNHEPVEAYYFSTSAGVTSTDEIWGEKHSSSFLKSVKCPFDQNTPWSRWKTTLPWSVIEERAQCTGGSSKQLLSAEIIRKSQSGAAMELQLVLQDMDFAVKGEYAIRRFLSPKGYEITEKNGEVTDGGVLLPSAYFDMNVNPGESITLEGSGFGHGVGMSQNGANEMAKEGYTCKDILEYFFRDVEITSDAMNVQEQ